MILGLKISFRDTGHSLQGAFSKTKRFPLIEKNDPHQKKKITPGIMLRSTPDRWNDFRVTLRWLLEKKKVFENFRISGHPGTISTIWNFDLYILALRPPLRGPPFFQQFFNLFGPIRGSSTPRYLFQVVWDSLGCTWVDYKFLKIFDDFSVSKSPNFGGNFWKKHEF